MIRCVKLLALCILMLSVPSLAFAAKTHRVKKNETLYSLAKKYHVTVAELKDANNLVGNGIKPRQLLVIPPRSVSEGKSTASAARTYKVRKNDTLSHISKRTGISVSELKRLNGLKNSRVKAGKVLVLRESAPAEEPKVKVAKKLQLRYDDLFSEKDYEQSLQELTATLEPEYQVDLAKNAELKVDSIRELKKSAYGFLGTRYRFGGTSRSGIDCSSFVQQVFGELEVSLPRTAREQFEVGNAVAPGDLQKGDLIFFATYASYPSHVGIYLGNNKMIHASSRSRKVVISSVNTSYYRARFLGAKRISKVNPDVFSLDDLILGVEEENPDDGEDSDAVGFVSTN